MKNKIWKYTLCGLLTAVIVLCAGFIGYKAGIDSMKDDTDRQLALSLPITVTVDYDAGFTVYSANDLNGHYEDGITYVNMSGVAIDIDGTSTDLAAAIREGFITVDEILALARIDAGNGFCEEVYHSQNGLTQFIYQYPSYDLAMMYDVFEAPDGNSYLMKGMTVYPPDQSHNNLSPLYITGENGEAINLEREDWGLTFDTKDVTPTGIHLIYNKTAGQQIGELQLVSYYIEKSADPEFDDPTTPIDCIPLAENTDTEIALDWSEAYGELSGGEYTLVLTVFDSYEESQLHPLMKNFADIQRYRITFTIP